MNPLLRLVLMLIAGLPQHFASAVPGMLIMIGIVVFVLGALGLKGAA
jgi:hypothetical protein